MDSTTGPDNRTSSEDVDETTGATNPPPPEDTGTTTGPERPAPPEESNRRGRPASWLSWRLAKMAAAAALSLALGWVLFITFQYHETKKPVSELPGVPLGVNAALAGQPPSFQQSFYGPEDTPFARPMGIAVSPKGDRLYVTQGGGERVTVVLSRDGGQLGTLVPPGTQAADRLPIYVAVDQGGTVFVSDRMRGAIDMYSPSGDYKGTYEPAESPPLAPMGLAFDKAGNFYVTDLPDGQHRLLVYDAKGRLKLTVGKEGADPGEFSFPSGVAVDSAGRIYVADANNGRVEVFDKAGTLLSIIGRGGKGSLAIPRGLAIDNQGRLSIVDTNGQAVEVWDVTGAEPKRLHSIGGQGVGNGQLNYPNGIALDQTGRMYVTDRMNDRVEVWSWSY